MTDPDSLACAMDRLLETALSTPDILSEYGNPKVGEFFVAKEPTVPAPKIILNISGGVLQDVFGSDSAISVVACDWDVEGCVHRRRALSSFPMCAVARNWRRWPSIPYCH